MKLRKTILASTLTVCALTGAQAGVITGSLWHVPEATSLNAVPANVPAGIPDVTFDVNGPLNFSDTNATVGNWLASGSAFNMVENTAGTLASQMDNLNIGSILEFTGLMDVANGQTFSYVHDDGMNLVVNGVNLGFSSGPTAPITETRTYGGASGNNVPFTLVYAECCEGPAVLQDHSPPASPAGEPTTVPEAPTLLLVGLGLAVCYFSTRQHQRPFQTTLRRA